MEGKDQKTETREKIEVILIVAADIFLIACWIFLPETGMWGMVNEAMGALLILSWSICFLIGGIKKKKEDKKAFILGIAGFICIFAFGGWLSKNVVMDLMTGSRTVHLTQITTHQSIGRIRFYYYLSGKDGSKNYRFKIWSFAMCKKDQYGMKVHGKNNRKIISLLNSNNSVCEPSN